MATRDKRKVSAIDQRLASRLHQQQIEAIIRTESAADALDRVFSAAARALIEAVTRDDVDLMARTREGSRIVSLMFTEGHDVLAQQFRGLARWSHAATARALTDVIPRRWFRAASPELAVLPLQEATMPLPVEPDQEIIPGQQVGPIRGEDMVADIYSEPVVRAPRMSDDDWQQLVSELIFPPPPIEQIEQILQRPNPHTGATWHERLQALSRKISNPDALAGQLAAGYAQGESIEQLRRRVEPLVQGIQSSARRIARTEGLRIAETTQRQSFDALGDMLVGTQVLAVLDQNTRPEHAQRNGTIYYKNPQPGQPGMSELPDLPDQPNCRCWTSPVLKTPEEFEEDPAVQVAFRNDGGLAIPDPAAYEQWFAKADVGRRKMAVGSARYETVRKMLVGVRDPEWTDFIDEQGRLLSATQLSRESILQRTSRKHRVQQSLNERARLVKHVASRGFSHTLQTPTLVPGQTFSGKVDPTDELSVLGEEIRRAVARGASGERHLITLGARLQEFIESPEVADLQKQVVKLENEFKRLYGNGNIQLKHVHRLDEIEQQLTTQRRQLVELRQARYLEAMSAVRDMGSDKPHPTHAESDPQAVRHLEQAQRFFPRDWIERFHADGEIKTTVERRGFYDHQNRRLALSHSVGGHRSTAVHELAHRAESLVPGLLEAEKRFYDRRTKRSKLREISFQPGEYTKRDSWLGSRGKGYGEYMGKYYGDRAYEIVTMGLEGIVYDTFEVEQDPEVYQFVLGALAAL